MTNWIQVSVYWYSLRGRKLILLLPPPTFFQKPNLILNVDGFIGVAFVDALRNCGSFTRWATNYPVGFMWMFYSLIIMFHSQREIIVPSISRSNWDKENKMMLKFSGRGHVHASSTVCNFQLTCFVCFTVLRAVCVLFLWENGRSIGCNRGPEFNNLRAAASVSISLLCIVPWYWRGIGASFPHHLQIEFCRCWSLLSWWLHWALQRSCQSVIHGPPWRSEQLHSHLWKVFWGPGRPMEWVTVLRVSSRHD